MNVLLADQEVRKRWDPEQLWSVVASLSVHLAFTQGTVSEADRHLAQIRKAPPAVVLMPIANITWDGEPLKMANFVVGDWDDDAFSSAASNLAGSQAEAVIARYVSEQPHRRPVIGFATRVPAQRSLAFTQATQRLMELCDVALLLSKDKDEHELWSLRGAWNRPGVRGLALDRPALEAAFRGESDSVELASQPLVLDAFAQSSSVHWYSANPFPLSKVLEDVNLREAVEWVLDQDVAVARRIRLAARWFAEAFYSTGNDDAALSLGVALDALIGAKGGLPGRAMRERFALLEPVPAVRPTRATRYDEIFAVRSSVAHGGASRRLDSGDFVRGVHADVTWAAWRLLAARDQLSNGAADLDQTFDELRWGMLRWPEPAEPGCSG